MVILCLFLLCVCSQPLVSLFPSISMSTPAYREACLLASKVWEDSRGKLDKNMKQAMLLPHEILGSMYSSGRLDLATGSAETRLNKSHACSYMLTVSPTDCGRGTLQPATAQALSSFWKSLEHTAWFRNHPLLAVSCQECWGCQSNFTVRQSRFTMILIDDLLKDPRLTRLTWTLSFHCEYTGTAARLPVPVTDSGTHAFA